MSEGKQGLRVDEFVTRSWLFFAPYAYEKYLRGGRGAVRIDISQIKLTPREGNWVDVDGPIGYLGIDSDEILDIGDDNLDDRLEGYDPEREVCFLFVETADDGTIKRHILVGAPLDQPPPKELYDSRGRPTQ